ncbi:MAG TPA: alkaline phosphatase D family protein [Steroidobacteraceae bacterium]|nr:alkaline phosphatase D family protein [Steroidobacteraceae bacterium]
MLTRRKFAEAAAAAGAVLAFGRGSAAAPAWRERRDLYPQGVASGDPAPDSVLLWTRRQPAGGDPRAAYLLTVEVSKNKEFRDAIARGKAEVTADTDWTCRFMAAGLTPATEYWYRFTDADGNGSRVGRTLTAPGEGDARPVRFTFVSCQDMTIGAANAYRRMIFEDERRPRGEQLGFVLHLGDFIYEVLNYADEMPEGKYRGRRLRPLFKYPDGDKFRDYHLPATLADYRTVYRAYLTDPDLQDARARWPFVPVWDNHEFSWQGYQGIQVFGGEQRPAQTKKVAANQAWWEFQPARVARPGANKDRFEAPTVKDTPITGFDENGFGVGADNAAAVASLTIYRAFRYGRNAELILTDNRSYKIADADASAVSPDGFPMFADEDTARVIDDGRTANGGKPPATLKFAGQDVPNAGVDQPMQTYLGPKQRAWLIDRLSASQAPWKVWGHSFGTLAWRSDLANLPEELGPKWPGTGFGLANGGYYSEHAQIYDVLRKKGVTGLAVVAGDKHSFWAGLTSADLPPRVYDPVGVEFVTGSISAQGLVEIGDRIVKPDHALRALYYTGEHREIPAINYTLLHGVRAALALSQTSAAEARKLHNPAVAPHLKFVDLGGHGYGLVTVTADWLETEFVCIPVPFERSDSADGGPLRYRVRHRVDRWKAGEQPKLAQTVVEGNADYSI